MASRAWAGLLLLVFVAGCSGAKARERFYPPEDRARQALDAALAAWQRGEPPGPVSGTAPLVNFVDSHQKSGQRLQAYTIESMAPGDGPRVLTVKLTLASPTQDVKARYVVYGVDPIWVVRHEDYEQLAHWCEPAKP